MRKLECPVTGCFQTSGDKGEGVDLDRTPEGAPRTRVSSKPLTPPSRTRPALAYPTGGEVGLQRAKKSCWNSCTADQWKVLYLNILPSAIFNELSGTMDAFNYCVSITKGIQKNLAEVKNERIDYRSVTVELIDLSSPTSVSNRSVVVECANTEVCKVFTYPTTVSFPGGENASATFEVEIEALFLGVTELNVSVNDEVLPPYELRVLRSNRDAKVQLWFNIFLAIFIFIISTMMGTQLEVKQIFGIVRKPVGPTIGLFTQFGMMPVIGFLLAEYGLPADAMSLKMALFATATCPGGGKSSFWTIIFGGNLDLSISMTFSQTLAALFMMPMWMSTLGKHFTDAHVRIPFARIVEGLIALMIPTSIGMIVTYYRPQYIECIRKWIKRVSWAATIVISIFAIYSNYYIFWLLSWPIVLCGCALPWLGYITAFIVATLLRQQFKDALTIAIETGIQNIGIAMLLMIWCLPEPESDIAITIIFVTAIMTDKPLVIIWIISRIFSKCCKRDTVKQVDDLEAKVANLSTATIMTDVSNSLGSAHELKAERTKS